MKKKLIVIYRVYYSINTFKMATSYLLIVEDAKYLELFEDIPYKYIKNIIYDDEEQLVVEITALDCDRVAYCRSKFEFELEDKKFKVIKEYNTSSPYALYLCGLEANEEEEEDEEEEEKEDEEEDEE